MVDLQYSQGDEAFLRMAHHESGHTLVMSALGIGVEYVNVVQLDRVTAVFETKSPNGSESKPVEADFKNASCTHRCLIKRAGEVAERRYAKVVRDIPPDTAVLPTETWQLDYDYIKNCFTRSAGVGDPDQDPAARRCFESFLNHLSTILEQWFDDLRTAEKTAELIKAIEGAREPNGDDRSRAKLDTARIAELLNGLPQISAELNVWPLKPRDLETDGR